MPLTPRCVDFDCFTGPKTTHFWGPVANWGFVLAVSSIILQQLVQELAGIWHLSWITASTSALQQQLV